MSSLHSGFNEFKEKCKVKNAIITYTRKHNKILIYEYCLQKDIDIKNEENKLKFFATNMGSATNMVMGSHFRSCPH